MMGMDYGLAKRPWTTTSPTSSSDLSSIPGVYYAGLPTLPHLYLQPHPLFVLPHKLSDNHYVRRGTGDCPLDQSSGEKTRVLSRLVVEFLVDGYTLSLRTRIYPQILKILGQAAERRF